MPKYCVRCDEQTYATEEHLCADLKRRYARREKQVLAVMALLEPSRGTNEQCSTCRAKAEEIVKVLANLGVADD